MTRTEGLQSRWAAAMMDTYGTPALALVRGEGCLVWDADGREYVDLLGGIAVNLLGHAHPAVVRAVCDQVATVAHVSNLYVCEPAVALAERLLSLAGRPQGRVFLANSGTEANEAAVKLARRYGLVTGGPAKRTIVAAEGSFHGRTVGALSVTGQPAKREPFGPLLADVRFVPYGDVPALAAAVDDTTAAVLLEPILGEAGVIPPPPGYLAEAGRLARDRGALLVLDEVQTGMGRTGTFFAHEADGVLPDVVTMAKGLGGGLPIGACIAFGPAAQVLGRGQHGSTFGGNPVACAAALAVLGVLAEQALPVRAAALGERLTAGLSGVAHPLLAGVRGRGLLQALVLAADVAPAVEQEARAAGFLVNAAAPDAVRLAPALVVVEEQLDAFTAALPAILRSAEEAVSVGR